MIVTLKKAEAAGYAKGYTAGKRRAVAETTEQRREARQALMDQLYASLLPIALTAQGWKINDVPVITAEQRTRLAAEWVRYAMQHRPEA